MTEENKEIELRDDLLIWIDLETTGLDQDNNMRGVHDHKILEIGLHITDNHYNIIDPGLEIIIHQDENVIKPLMVDFVRDMHEKNGLLEKVKNSTTTLEEAEKMMIEYVKSYNIKPETSPIAGNNVGFDKNFLAAQMPEFTKVLHYRKIDVSTIKEIVARQYPEVKKLLVKTGSHRALDDIKESIKELQLYQEHIFVPKMPKEEDKQEAGKKLRV